MTANGGYKGTQNSMDYFTDIYDYITRQEALYGTGIPVNEKWSWSMKEHILTTELYTNSQLINGKTEWTPVKNITKPILNLEHRTEDIEVKDVQLYVDDPEKYYLSFLVKKYHDDVFVQENDMDTFFDELNVSRIDYGGGLSKKLNKPAPEVVPLQSIAFCDQTDMLSGPIGIKHYYSPDQLLEMEAVGWGKAENGASMSISELLTLATHEKKGDNQNQSVKTPGRYVEVYEVHGNLPKRFADPTDDSGLYETRLFICAFYQGEGSENKSGAVLYTKLEPQSPFKLIKRDPVYGRALGFGGAEELFEAQVWTNYDMIRIQDMLDAAAKTILKTTDPTVAGKNKLKDMDNLEIIELTQGTDLSQVDTFPRNMKLFETSMAQWEDHAQKMGAATEAVLGESPSAGTPFKLQQEVIKQGLGLHEYRRGQYAKHLEEIYRDWIIPHIQKKICEGTTFLSELSLEEMQYVADALVTNATNDLIKRKVIEGTLVQPDEVTALKEIISGEFKKKGSKHFIEILKGEFKNTPLAVKVSVKGKSKDLSARTDGLVNVFRQIIANPAVLQIPAMGALFNQIIEASGLDPMDFTGFMLPPGLKGAPEQPQPGVEQPQMPVTV
jgi:hypothetical protein